LFRIVSVVSMDHSMSENETGSISKAEKVTEVKLETSVRKNKKNTRKKSKNAKTKAKKLKSNKTSTFGGESVEFSSGSDDYLIDDYSIAEIDRAMGEIKNLNLRLQETFAYEDDSKEICEKQTDSFRNCFYDVSSGSSKFECKCQPTPEVKAFQSIDKNQDNVVTKEEFVTYIDENECIFPFRYTSDDGIEREYNSCTDADDANGFEWCSTKTLNGVDHQKGFFKYCTQGDNLYVFEEYLKAFDENKDGEVNFSEIRGNQGQLMESKLVEWNVADPNLVEWLVANPNPLQLDTITSLVCPCGVSEFCSLVPNLPGSIVTLCESSFLPDRVIIDAICALDFSSVLCKMLVSTEPLNDELLLRVLADASTDIYCDEDYLNYDSMEFCPTKRSSETSTWLIRKEIHDDEKEKNLVSFITCSALLNLHTLPQAIQDAVAFLLALLDIDYEELCSGVNIVDGKDALQWGWYEIGHGPHQGKTVLAFMGTDLNNIEQIIASTAGLVLYQEILTEMKNEAVAVANDLKPDFVTGHGIGGFLAELVCSETGISGASFAAPSTTNRIPFELFDVFLENPGNAINFVVDAVKTLILDLDLPFVSEELLDWITGIIESGAGGVSFVGYIKVILDVLKTDFVSSRAHSGVKFEVVQNENDRIALFSNLGLHSCRHISSRCDMRWQNFGSKRFLGHSMIDFGYETNKKWERNGKSEDGTTDLIILDGLKKNLSCDYCETENEDKYCESTKCHNGQCLDFDFKVPSECATESANKTPFCSEDSICRSSRCISGICQKKSTLDSGVSNGQECSYDTECTSGRCDSDCSSCSLTCKKKLAYRGRCNENTDCEENYCNTEKNLCLGNVENGGGCNSKRDCRSERCVNDICSKKLSSGKNCEENSDCINDDCTPEKKCRRMPAGELCSIDDECLGNWCKDSFCQEKLEDGSMCEEDNECNSNYCFGFICTPKGLPGTVCNPDNDECIGSCRCITIRFIGTTCRCL